MHHWSLTSAMTQKGGVLRTPPLFSAVAYAAFSFDLPIAPISVVLNAGISSGLRLVMNCPSVTTSLSTQFTPAFFRSVLIDGHEVIVFPFTTTASTSVHGPWQIAATGRPVATKSFTN